MLRKHQFGNDGESQALSWYLAQGSYRFLARNFRWRRGEIDLIFEERTSSGQIELVFVEVRSCGQTNWISPNQTFRSQKIQSLERTALYFLSFYHGPAKTCRFDLWSWNGARGERLENILLEI